MSGWDRCEYCGGTGECAGCDAPCQHCAKSNEQEQSNG